MKKLLFLLAFLPTVGFAEGPLYRQKEPSLQLEFDNVYGDLRRANSVSASSAIFNQNTLQSGATAYPQFIYVGSSGTIPALSVTTMTVDHQINMTGRNGSASSPLIRLGTGNAGLAGNSTGDIVLIDNGSAYGSLGSSAWYAPNGVVGTPAYSFENDSDSGFYSAAANGISLSLGGTRRIEFTTTITRFYSSIDIEGGELRPVSAAGANLGSAANYWNDVNYKTLIDRGCLGWFDDGVEMPDGTMVSDLEACSIIKKHPTKKTVYGVPMLDYKSFPKVAYKKASYKDDDGRENFYLRDKDDEPFYWEVIDSSGTAKQYYEEKKPHKDAVKKFAADGIEMTSMFSIMIGALKEANDRIKVLEEKVAQLEDK